MTKWTIVIWLLSLGWSIQCQQVVTDPSTDLQLSQEVIPDPALLLLQSPGVLGNSKPSALAQMIAEALANKKQEDAKPINNAHVPKLVEGAELTTKNIATETTDLESDASDTTPTYVFVKKDDIVQGDEIIYEPVEIGQFGEPGEGSKFLEAIQNFDISKYSVESDGDYSTLAGIGAAALLTIGAIAAVPVAPLILRRTGTSGWGGLPSFSEMWGWWSDPDPVAERFVNGDYNDNYLNRPHQQQRQKNGGRPNKNRPAKRPYQQTAQRPYQQYQEEEDTYEYDYGVSQGNQYDNGAYYPDYYDSGSSPSNTNQNYESESEPSSTGAQAPSGQYNRPSGQSGHHAQAPTGQYKRPSVEHVRLPHHSGNHHPVAHNRRQNKPQKNKEMTKDGHEYTTVEELNKLGEESLKTIYEQFSAHMQGQNIQDFYQEFENNNELRRRQMNAENTYQERRGHVQQGDLPRNYLNNNYRSQESEDSMDHWSQQNINSYRRQESDDSMGEDEPTKVSEFPYDYEKVQKA